MYRQQRKGPGLDNIESIRLWFFANNEGLKKYPYWTVYRGADYKNRLWSHKNQVDIETAWASLEEALTELHFVGGTYSLMIAAATEKVGLALFKTPFSFNN